MFRSEDGSLKPPKGFNGKWRIVDHITIWTMRCPRGYVSLGAIATNNKHPDVSKYRCVVIKEAIEAEMGKTIL